MKNICEQYLQKYAEPEAAIARTLDLTGTKKFALVIPSFDEQPLFIERFLAHKNAYESIVILVINQPQQKPFKKNPSNIALLNYFDTHGKKLDSKSNLTLYQLKDLVVLVVNKCESHLAISPKEGVGAARKIGADIAVSLIDSKHIQTPIIYSTDADASLPENYFLSLNDRQNLSTSAWVFDYNHANTKTDISSATLLYEKAIKYYKDGLVWAKSPYAFHTLGSVLALNAHSYCQVRGFPKLAAGEDFYLLNKLAKVGDVVSVNDCIIELEPRASLRVPFGTGPSAVKILEDNPDSLALEQLNYSYYHPQCFAALKQCLEKIPNLWEYILKNRDAIRKNMQNKTSFNSFATELCHSAYENTSNKKSITDALISLKIDKFISHAAMQCSNLKNFSKQFHCWFDGFQTLKFIHAISFSTYRKIQLKECLALSKTIFH